MEFLETIPDQETVDSTNLQIHYYTNLPKHVRGSVTELNIIKPHMLAGGSNLSPAFVVSGSTTVPSEFSNKNSFN